MSVTSEIIVSAHLGCDPELLAINTPWTPFLTEGYVVVGAPIKKLGVPHKLPIVKQVGVKVFSLSFAESPFGIEKHMGKGEFLRSPKTDYLTFRADKVTANPDNPRLQDYPVEVSTSKPLNSQDTWLLSRGAVNFLQYAYIKADADTRP